MVVVLAVPAMVLVVIAFAALIMAWFRPQGLQPVIDQFLRGVPIVGAQIADAAAGIGRGISDWITGLINGMVQPLVDFLDFGVGWARTGIQGATGVLTWLWLQAHSLWSVIDTGLASLRSSITSIGLTLQADAAAISRLVLQAASLAASVANIITVRIPAAIVRAETVAATFARTAIAAAVSSLEAFVLARISAVLAMLGAETLARAAGDAAVRAAAAAEAANVARAATAALAAERAIVAGELGQVAQAIEGVDAKIGQWAVPATIAAALTATMTEVQRIGRCNDPMCSFLSPQLSILNAIEDVAMLAALADFIGHAAHDPQEAARDTLADAEGFIGVVVGLFGDITGVGV